MVDKLSEASPPDERPKHSVFDRGSKDLTEETSVRDATDSLRWEDSNNSSNNSLNNSISLVSPKPFDRSLPILAEHETELTPPLTDSQCCTTQEFGSIHYPHDSLDSALRQGKPIFLVQVEIPGDKMTGLRILSHPLIVEAAEAYFENVGIVLAQLEAKPKTRPTINSTPWSTTIRILNQDGTSVVPDLGGERLSIGEVAKGMIGALSSMDISVPTYLQMLEEEEYVKDQINTSSRFKILERTARFGASDCSQAEVDIAAINAVIGTRVGLFHGKKILEVSYFGVSFASLLQSMTESAWLNVHTVYYATMDERISAQLELAKMPQQPNMLKIEDLSSINFSAVSDCKSALRRTELRYVPMTKLQALRANRLVHNGQFHKATHLLSPRQGAILMRSYSNVSLRKDVIDVPIDEAWELLKSPDDNYSQ